MNLRLLIIRSFVSFLLYGGIQYVSVAQKQQQPNCGTEISPEQAKALQQQVILALKKKMATNSVFTTLTYVPIRPHIIRRTDGGANFDLAALNSAMAATNRYFMTNGLGIQFYFAGETPHYINDDNLYYNFPYYNVTPLLSFDVSNALNQYYPYTFDSPVGGYAYYPDNALYSTRSVIGTSGSINFIGNHLIPHELGHNFSLIHTHGVTNGIRTNELVTRGAGANCTTAGDQICDTPADPFLTYTSDFDYSYDEDGCPQYSSNNTPRDANGDAYTPMVNNLMSYYHLQACPEEFTPGQYERIQAGLAIRQGHTAYTLDYPAVNVPVATNLTATMNGLSTVQLSWQDNASNEMGYFIERSTSPSVGFIAVGGVAPNAMSFTDRTIIPNTTYYYRIRPSNTTTGSLSPNAIVATPTLPPVMGLTTTNITGTSAQLNWNSLGEGVEYDIQWRQVGSPTWNTIRRISYANNPIGFLASNTTYEWQVKASLGSTYSGPVTFTTICQIPVNLYSTAERIRAQLSWGGASDQLYTLQWRQAGMSDWATINNLDKNTYTLTDLTSATVYEWRVQGVCQSTVQSEFSSPQSFTTRSCQLPYNTTLNSVGGDWASVSWFFSTQDPPRTVDLRYRLAGTPTWTTVSSLSTTSTIGTYQITGLANNTSYEWQIRTVCSASEQTDYTSPSSFSFTTLCRTPGSLSATTSATQANLGWRITPSTPNGATFILQYRPTGSPNWTTTTSSTATFTGGFAKLTGLTTGTTYEWCVQTACSPTALSDFSPIAYFTTNCSVPSGFSVAFLTSTSVQLNWNVVDDPVNHYDVRYRPVGSPDWTTISVLGTNTTLNGLTNSTTYEWQLRTVCYQNESAPFTSGPNFTTRCRIPTFQTATPQITSATLNWEMIGPNTTNNIRYRKLGTTDWITITNVIGASYSLTNLTGNTTYEWNMETRCSDGATYGYISGLNFTTYTCDKPSPSLTTNLTPNSAQLNWYFSFPSAETRYQIRYRTVGGSNWIILDNLTSTSNIGSMAINGLASGTTYEWQIRTLCSATESSAFTTVSTFKTSLPCPIMYTIQTGLWNDPATWSCNRIPFSDDAVQIKHQVVLPASYVANARRINYDAGKAILYGTGAQLKLGF